MRRMGGWLSARTTLPQSKSLTALDEPHALADAMRHASLIMNDEVERAEAELSKGTSPFHQVGVATALFLRAALGFERDAIKEASQRLANAEEAASEHQRRALRDPSSAHQSKIYPSGAEYALCQVETSLMIAVIAVLNESLTESLKGFYRLRKALLTLQGIIDAENRYLAKHKSTSSASLSSSVSSDSPTSTPDQASSAAALDKIQDDEDDLDFKDAVESSSSQPTPIEYQGHLEIPSMKNGVQLGSGRNKLGSSAEHGSSTATSLSSMRTSYATTPTNDQLDFGAISTDQIDIFIHSGATMCFGLLQLLLSMIPPAFGKILSIFSFRGDREDGLRLLWEATNFKENINGAMAAQVLLPFHNAAIALCDIYRREAYPKSRLQVLLRQMKTLYPNSVMWALEEARMFGVERDLESAVDSLTASYKPSALKQMEALRIFELGMATMFLHRYEDCSNAFIRCVDVNNWSHALYYYIAGSCHVEMYRVHCGSDPQQAEKHRGRAIELLLQVTLHVGKKRFMARQLPLDIFIARKVAKWQARAKARDCDMIEAVGVSPLEEMIYFWSGHKRMRKQNLETSLASLAWPEKQPSWADEPVDERAILASVRAACLRNLGQVQEAKTILVDQVQCYNLAQIKACEHADNWTLPVSHYEMAVCYWNDAGGQDGDRALLQKCSQELAKVEAWESFELEARVGMKLTTARQTLTQCGIS